MNLLELARSALANRADNDRLYGVSKVQQQVESADDPASARRREKVAGMLAADPNLRIALVVSDPDADPVVCTVGIRHVAVGEIEIPAAYYDPVTLLELLDKDSARTDCEMRKKGQPWTPELI